MDKMVYSPRGVKRHLAFKGKRRTWEPGPTARDPAEVEDRTVTPQTGDGS